VFFINPFRPGKRLTSPELFAGRQRELHDATQRVIQAASDNAMHTLVTGERGIGKSSFSSQLQGILLGDETFLNLIGANKADQPFKFLVAEHVAQKGQGAAELAIGLLAGLEGESKLKRYFNYSLDFQIDLGPLKTTAKQKTSDTSDVITEFIAQMAKVIAGSGGADGVILVVDEVDRVAGKAGVSTFFKVTTERLSAAGMNNVAFVLIGMIGTLDDLKREHASVGRVFLPQPLPLLTKPETVGLLTKALLGTKVTIDADAASTVFDFSGGYPNAVHLIGESAFTLAMGSERVITKQLVREAVDKVIAQSAPEDFDPLYLRFKGRSRQLIRLMASYDEPDVPSKYLLKKLNVKATDISNNFDTMLNGDVIVRPQDGYYRLRDPLFREYVRDLVVRDTEPVQRRPQKREAE